MIILEPVYIYVKNRINSMANLRFCSIDAITMEVSAVVGDCRRTIRFSSVYLPYEEPDPPSAMVRDIVQHSAEKKKEILQIDANAHHILWGSTDINTRGESLMEYMISTNLNILNKGNEPTFLNVGRRQVIDLTLGTTLVGNLVSDWHVSSEDSLSDHRYICFKIESQVFDTGFTRNPRRLIGLEDLSALIGGISKNICLRLDLGVGR